MKIFGAILIVIGFLAGIASFMMDTSVSGEHAYERVVNIGLVADKIVAMIASCATVLAGVVLGSIGELIDIVDPEKQRIRALFREDAQRRRAAEAEQAKQVATASQKRWDDWKRDAPARKARRRQARAALARKLRNIPAGFDNMLYGMAGAGNAVLYRFFQLLAYVILPVAVVVVVLLCRG